jgi:hypothetical protein
MGNRIHEEIHLLRQYFQDLVYHEETRWVLVPRYMIPPGMWDRDEVAVCFQIPPGYPGQKPYGFYVSPRVQLRGGGAVKNRTDSSEAPFAGEWAKFSWDMPAWHATADLQTGSNLLNFVLTFRARFEQGA